VIFEQLAIALKYRVALKFFTALNIHFTFRSFDKLRLPWKTESPWNFSLYWICIFEQLALALKTEFALKIFKPGGGRQSPDR